jgi:XRE family transcriptional regulator, master regulator for biofilm formation
MIGKRIQKLRLDKGMSLSDVADQAGVAKSYLSTIEREIQHNPSISFIEKISAVLGVSPQELLQYNDDEPLDAEWLEIVREAQRSGVTKEQFLEFLAFTKWKLDKLNNDAGVL